MKVKFLILSVLFSAFAVVSANAQAKAGETEIAQAQEGAGTFPTAKVTKGASYTTYQGVGGDVIEVYFKMLNVDVAGCDYVRIQFAEAPSEKMNVSFYSGQNMTGVFDSVTDADHPGSFTVSSDKKEITYAIPAGTKTLPQIGLLSPLDYGGTPTFTVKVVGVYKHKSTANAISKVEGDATVVGIFDLSGKKLTDLQSGVNIVKYSDGTTKKVVK